MSGSSFPPVSPVGPAGAVQYKIGASFGGGSGFIYNPAANATTLAVSGGSYTGSSGGTFISLNGTWNTTAACTGILLNITNTTSGGASKLIDIQASGTSFASVDTGGSVAGTRFYIGNGGNGVWDVNGVHIPSTSYLGFCATTNATGGLDTQLYRDAAGTLALRGGVNAQTDRKSVV